MYLAIFPIPSRDNQIIKKTHPPRNHFKDHLGEQPDFVLDEQLKVLTHDIASTWKASKEMLYWMASF